MKLKLNHLILFQSFASDSKQSSTLIQQLQGTGTCTCVQSIKLGLVSIPGHGNIKLDQLVAEGLQRNQDREYLDVALERKRHVTT